MEAGRGCPMSLVLWTLLGLISITQTQTSPNDCSRSDRYTVTVQEAYAQSYMTPYHTFCSSGWEGETCTTVYRTAYRTALRSVVRYQCCPGYYASGGTCVPRCTQGCVHGRCVSPNTCRCQSGWGGLDCKRALCTQGCVHGRCVSPDTCRCRSGWGGLDCNRARCTQGCVHGRCVSPDTCRCRSGWEGLDCNRARCTQGCVHGRCVSPNNCKCRSGWGGLDCNRGAGEDRLGIVGGNETEPHSRPYMVSLQEFNQIEKQWVHECGGILISEDFVLTAAHCNDFEQCRVVLGAHSLPSAESTQQVLEVSDFIPHPEYNDKPKNNDIMLLKLNKKASLTSSVKVIPLLPLRPRPGEVCSTAGWGEKENGTYPDELREVETTILGATECTERYRGRVRITENMLCATVPGQIKGFCSGDSGGPLVCDGMAAGIVSFSGDPCGEDSYPDVYALISRYITWIDSILKRG